MRYYMSKCGFYSVLRQRVLDRSLTVVPRPREQLVHPHCNSSTPADISRSTFLLSPRRGFPRSHPCNGPCNQGLGRPRLRCAGQAGALHTALASLPEDTTCHHAPTHAPHALISGQRSSCSKSALQYLLPKSAHSTRLPLPQRGTGSCVYEIPILIRFSYKQAEWRFLSCQETKPVPL